MLKQKKILLCVTGGIAVFKAVALTSKLVSAGADVRVILTEAATKFVTPLMFQSLSRHEVYTDTFQEVDPERMAHIDLANWADVIIIAPATANTIGKLAGGIADNMVTTTITATPAPVIVVPAMNKHMLANQAVVRNLEQLQKDGYHVMESASGRLACGHVGKGRMLEPEEIIVGLEQFFSEQKCLTGKKILITAGPTIEKIDPVRFLSNFSSGKMGYALAEVAAKWGADVTLVSGPVHLSPPAGVKVLAIESADEMYQTVMEQFRDCDCVIATAAVADYAPVYQSQKIKKSEEVLQLDLVKTKDILATMGQEKGNQLVVGFAAETNDVEAYALGKMAKKNADMVIANDITRAGAGFASDTNIVTIYQLDREPIDLPVMSKVDVAREVLQVIAEKLADR